MKRIEKRLLAVFIVIFIFLIKMNVFAEVTIVSDDQLSTIKLTLVDEIPEGNNNTAYRKTATGNNNKVYNGYCISGYNVSVMSETCTYKGRSEAFAAIIDEASGGNTGSQVSDDVYAIAQLALAMYNRGDRSYCPDNGSQCTRAREIYDSAISGSLKTKIDKQKSGLSMTKTEDFKLNSSNNYVAKFTVSGGDKISSISNCTVKKGNAAVEGATTSSNGSVVEVSVPKDSVSKGENQITLSCAAAREFRASQYFHCSDGYQEIALAGDRWRETGTVNSTANIEVDPEKGSIKVTKKGKNSTVLQGVSFKIKNSKGKTIDATGKEDNNYVFKTDEHGVIEVKNIEISDTASENKYTIEEVEPLPGYIKATPVTVTLTEDKPNVEKTITNNLVKVTISKKDATGKKELPGAKLSILDKNEKVLNKCIFDDENNLITYSDSEEAKACTWVSTETSKILEGLPVGKYYLVEDIAPDGYAKSSEKIEIEITENGAVKDEIVMKNVMEVPVADTLSARSTLLLVIAMFDIALGIGILIYVKNNKVEE